MFLFCFWGGSKAQVTRAQFKLPDTWETQSYTNTFGEDHDYTRFKPALSNLNDSIVYDSVTTLIWMKYDGGEMTVDSAVKYCNNLVLKGHSQWRLPNPYEAFSILNQQVTNPAVPSAYFPKTGAEYWWTSDKQFNDAKKWWCTNAGGGIGNHPITETVSAGGTKKFHARCVETTQTYTVKQRFVLENDSLINDSFTGLQWYLIPLGSSINWENALISCENATLAGHDDWRLPNIKELQSIHSSVNVQPSQNSLFKFPIGHYWSSTTLPNQTTKSWYWENGFGITTYELKTNALYVAAVRTMTGKTSQVVEINKPEIRWAPNPSKGFPMLMVKNKMGMKTIGINDSDLTIHRLINSQGSLVTSSNVLPDGIYIIDYSYQGQYQSEKIVIIGN